jgi:[acyl-carrier-protein] S-malonyltransferase
MKPAEDAMDIYLSSLNWKDAKFEIVSNFTAKASRSSAVLKKNLVSQVTGAVRWSQTIAEMKNKGHRQFVEVGCGKVLSGLNKKIDGENLKTWNINSMEDFRVFEKEFRG